MKRALAVTESDRLSFFRLYDGCLMDAAVIAWCKLFGNDREKTHWRRLFQDPCKATVKAALLTVEPEFDDLVQRIRRYRDTYVAHHDLDQGKRANTHPDLGPMRATGLELYKFVFKALASHGQTHGLPAPELISGGKLEAIEKHWASIVRTARSSLSGFDDCPS
jgi:hypothetical protein